MCSSNDGYFQVLPTSQLSPVSQYVCYSSPEESQTSNNQFLLKCSVSAPRNTNLLHLQWTSKEIVNWPPTGISFYLSFHNLLLKIGFKLTFYWHFLSTPLTSSLALRFHDKPSLTFFKLLTSLLPTLPLSSDFQSILQSLFKLPSASVLICHFKLKKISIFDLGFDLWFQVIVVWLRLCYIGN